MEGSGDSSSRRPWKDSRRLTGDSGPRFLGSSRGSQVGGERWRWRWGGDGGGGGAANTSNGSITKNFAGMVYRTISRGGVTDRKGGGHVMSVLLLLRPFFAAGPFPRLLLLYVACSVICERPYTLTVPGHRPRASRVVILDGPG